MSDTETRALGRAAVVLLVASLARWSVHAGDAPPPAAPDEAAALLERSRTLEEDEEARRRPLGPEERIDPNTASEEELDRLPGVGAATARAIVRAREAQGAFRSAGDLSRVRGIGPATVKRMAGHLDFSQAPGVLSVGPAEDPGPVGSPSPVDVNRASATELEALPGIGPALAGRIVAARGERPFSSVDDLGRVRGIGPATLERLRPLVVVRR